MILDWERLSTIPRYTSLLTEVSELFERDSTFKADCLMASRWVMTQKASETDRLTDEALRLAVKYFLSEIPLFADTSGIVGKSASVFCYHQRVDFLEQFYARKLSYKPQEQQGFVILKSTTPIKTAPLLLQTMKLPYTDSF